MPCFVVVGTDLLQEPAYTVFNPEDGGGRSLQILGASISDRMASPLRRP